MGLSVLYGVLDCAVGCIVQLNLKVSGTEMLGFRSEANSSCGA